VLQGQAQSQEIGKSNNIMRASFVFICETVIAV